MGKLEQETRIRIRNARVSRAILTALVVAAAGVLNPTALVSGLLREFKADKRKRRSMQNSVYAARGRLLQRGYVEYGGGFLRVTAKGRSLLQHMEASDYRLEKPKRWDKKWRMLIFDIREERKSLRNKIRQTLVAIGFLRLQDSVWVFPYDCEDLILLLKADFKIGKDLLYIIADTIENDTWLKKEFQLD